MKKINNLIKIIFTLYLVIAFAGFVLILMKPNENEAVAVNNASKHTGVAQKETSASKPSASAKTTTANTTAVKTTATATTAATTQTPTTTVAVTTQAPTTTAVATTQAPTTTTAVTTQAPTTTTTATTQAPASEPYKFANGTFSRGGSYTYTVKNAAYVNLHESADGNSPIYVVPGGATGKVIAVNAYYSRIEYNGIEGYVFNEFLELH